MCGECCTSVTIPVEASKAEALQEKPWVQDRLKLFNRELVKIDKDFYRMPLRDNQYCVFLGDDNRCLIEVNEGEAAKPDECKRFPFARVASENQNPESQNTVFYDTSAVCKTVTEALLEQFAPIVPQPGREPPSRDPATDDSPLPEKIRAYGNIKINQAGYNHYCQSVWAICANPALTPPVALRQVQSVLLALPKEPVKLPESAVVSAFWQRWLPIFLLRKPYGLMSSVELLADKTYHDPKIFGEAVNLRDLPPGGDTAESALQRGFLANILTRKVLLTYGHSLESILSMACAAMVLSAWYARVLAGLQGKTQAGRDEWVQAIRLTERYYTGHQPQFPERFRQHFFWKTLHRKLLGGSY